MSRLWLSVVCAALLTGSVSAQQQGQPSFVCPDDGSVVIASNVGGTTDKIVTVVPDGPDQRFRLEVYNPTTGEVVDSVEISEDTQPPITMPPGTKTRVKDRGTPTEENPNGPPDGDSGKPKGTIGVAPA